MWLQQFTQRLFARYIVLSILLSLAATAIAGYLALLIANDYEDQWTDAVNNAAIRDLRTLNSIVRGVEQHLVSSTNRCFAQYIPNQSSQEYINRTVARLASLVASESCIQKCFLDIGTIGYMFATQQLSGTLINGAAALHDVFQYNLTDVNAMLSTETAARQYAGMQFKRPQGYYLFDSAPSLTVTFRTCEQCEPVAGIEVHPDCLLQDAGADITAVLKLNDTIIASSQPVDPALAAPCDEAFVLQDYVQTAITDTGMCAGYLKQPNGSQVPSFPLVPAPAYKNYAFIVSVIVYALCLVLLCIVAVRHSSTVFCKLWASAGEIPDYAASVHDSEYTCVAAVFEKTGYRVVDSFLEAIDDLLITLSIIKPYMPCGMLPTSKPVDESSDSSEPSVVEEFELTTTMTFMETSDNSPSRTRRSQTLSSRKSTQHVSKGMKVHKTTIIIAVSVQHQYDYWVAQDKEMLMAFEMQQTSFVDFCCSTAKEYSGIIDSVVWDTILIQFNTAGKSFLSAHASAADVMLNLATHDWSHLGSKPPKMAFGCCSGPSMCGQVGSQQKGNGVYSGVRLLSTHLASIGLKRNITALCDHVTKSQCEPTHHLKPVDILASRMIRGKVGLPPRSIIYEVVSRIERSTVEQADEWMYQAGLQESRTKFIEAAFTCLKLGDATKALSHFELHVAENPSDALTKDFADALRRHLKTSPEATYYMREPMECRTYWVGPETSNKERVY